MDYMYEYEAKREYHIDGMKLCVETAISVLTESGQKTSAMELEFYASKKSSSID